jgi:MFS family permease
MERPAIAAFPGFALPRNVRFLLATRLVRSAGQGVTVVSFALYLHALGYSGAAIGAVLMSGLLFGAALTAIVGPLSDRRGRRGLLIAYESAAALAAFAALLSRNEIVLIIAATVAGFGRGANGAAGPFAPVEQAWLAREVAGPVRRRALAFNATLGFFGMATGAALVALPGLFGLGFVSADSYRILFAVPLVGSLIAIALLLRTHEPRAGAPRGDVDHALTRAENRQLRRLATTNMINGFAIGIVGPLIAYWFVRRFGQRLEMIGPALALGFLLGGAGSTVGGFLSARFGAVRVVLAMRLCGLLLLIATPFSPTFLFAAGAYALRSAFNQGTAGPRQAIAAELTRPERRGFAASVQSLSLQIPRAAGPVLGGWLIHRGEFTLPFLLAAGLQAVYLVLYWRFFMHLDRGAVRGD